MATINEVEVYLKSIVTPQNFFIFSALTGLKNVENYRKVINLLMSNRLNLSELTRLTFIDDQAISELLDTKSRLEQLNSAITSATGSVSAYTYLMGTDLVPTQLSILMKEYNTFVSGKVSKEANAYIALPVLYLDFTTSDSSYSSIGEVKTLLTPIIGNLNTKLPLPVYTPNASLSVNQKKFLNDLASLMFSETVYTDTYRLLDIFVWSNGSPSLVSNKIQELTTLINLEKYKDTLELLLRNDIYSIDTSITYNSTTINNIWNEFFSRDFSSIPIDDIMVYCLYTICKIRTVEQNNNLSVSNQFYNSFLALYEYASSVSKFLQDSTLELTNVLSLKSL